MKRCLLASLASIANSKGTMNHVMTDKPVLRGVCFDMDGTLTIPNLDFGEMYRRCGVDRSKDILKEIALMTEAEQKIAFDKIDELEEEGRRTLELMPGALELTSWLKAHNIPMALITRNTRKTANVLTNKLFPPNIFDSIITRDADYLAKPNPDALHAIAKEWSVELPSEGMVMVGDSVHNDIAFGRNAGVATALLDTDDTMGMLEPKADFIMSDLTALPHHLWQNYNIESPLGTSTPTKLLKYPYPEPTTDLTKGAAAGDLESIRTLASQAGGGFDINAKDETGNTALIWAAENNHQELVQWILSEFQNNVELDHRGYLGCSAVLRASRRGHSEVLHALIQAGANLDLPNQKLQYPLHFAAFQEHQDIVELLLAHGVNTRSLDRKGRTPAEDTKNEPIRKMILSSR
eukprot:scaffold1442_cov128-Cylindrotheca_fusiformis.AAC.25